MDEASNTRRIAKNTLFLYLRMLFLLLVGLYTSRVVLDALGETDYGIYNVVGGFVGLFTVVSGTLSAAISRFLTYELGKVESGASLDRLSRIFTSSIIVQAVLAVVIIAIAEPLGLWFISEKMTIPPERIAQAQWVLQFSLLAFVINMISVPYNSVIIAHEHMGCFALVGIYDGIARLAVAIAIAFSSCDRLILYSALICAVAVSVRIIYGVYCRKRFVECRQKAGFDRKLTKEIFSFAGWNFIGVTASVLRDHGGNILINIFSGPAVNAARAVAFQLNNAVQGFVTNFMTALNPGITKSYAAGQMDYMHRLISKGARFSFMLLLLFALPLFAGTDWLLGLWLKSVPEHSAAFVRLFLLFSLSESLSNPLITAQLATGKIRNYQLIVGGIMLLNLPLSWICLHFGCPPETVIVVAIILSQFCFFARLILLRKMISLQMGKYLKEVYLRSLLTAVAAFVPTFALLYFAKGLHPVIFCLSALIFALASSAFIACSKDERVMIINNLKQFLSLKNKLSEK